MTRNRFGGPWTGDKLRVLRGYLAFYTVALKKQPFDLVYIDGFAGTGRCDVSDGAGGGQVIDGSATIALNNAPGFDRYWFIEPKRSHRAELEQLVAAHPNGGRATVMRTRADNALPLVLAAHDWRRTRGVLFLDPFGLQCEWQLLERVAATEALDMFFLLSLSGVYRQAAVRQDRIDERNGARLDRLFGSTSWRTQWYTRVQNDLFDEPQVSRDPGWRNVLDYCTERLAATFPTVEEPAILYGPNHAPLFALYFCVSNPSPGARALASRVSREVLRQLR